MPASRWRACPSGSPAARKDKLRGMPHRGKQDGAKKNDKDDLEKGVLDIQYGDDSAVWDGRVSKFWHDEGFIVVATVGELKLTLPVDLDRWQRIAQGLIEPWA